MLKVNRSSKNKIPTRRVVLSSKIDEARKLVIANDIELQFLKQLKEAMDKGEIKNTVDFTPEVVDKLIKTTQEQYEIYLFKLNFLKKMRDADIEKARQKFIKSSVNIYFKAPESIAVNAKNTKKK